MWRSIATNAADVGRRSDSCANTCHVSPDPLTTDIHPILSRPVIHKFEDEWPLGIQPWRFQTWPIPLETHPLSSLLQRIEIPKWTSLTTLSSRKVKLISSLDGRSLGTVSGLDLAALRPLLAPSPFGLGSQTIYDDNVRKGQEITAEKIQFEIQDVDRNMFRDFAEHIQAELFPGRPIKLVFYKLALYEPGGHFKLHRDTTHSDSHHGTLVVGCDIVGQHSYSHGEFVLSANGEEAVLRLSVGNHDAVAFYTDVQHAVNPVTEGSRATLQFDIYLEDSAVERPHTVYCINSGTRTRKSLKCSQEQAPFNMILRSAPHTLVVSVMKEFVYQLAELLRKSVDASEDASNDAAPRTVVFLLEHLYRQNSIRREYLKGADEALLHALEATGGLAVFLHPVVFSLVDADPRVSPPSQTLAICPPHPLECIPLYDEPVLVLDRGGESHIYKHGSTALGNDSGPDFSSYFAGAMFVTLAPGPPPDLHEHDHERDPYYHLDSEYDPYHEEHEREREYIEREQIYSQDLREQEYYDSDGYDEGNEEHQPYLDSNGEATITTPI